MKRALGACALILALAVSFMAPASAAQLVLTGGQHPFSSASARCDDAVAATTPSTSGTSSSVQVSGIAAACTGTLFVRVYDSSGVSKATGSATVVTGGGSQTLPVSPAYAPSATDKVSVTIGTWPVPATWSYTGPPAATGPVQPGAPGVVLTGLTWDLITNNPMQACFSVTAGTTSTVWIPWKIMVDISQPPFNGASTGYSIQTPGDHFALTTNSPSAGFFEVGPNPGRKGDGYQEVIGGPNPVTMTVQICNYGLPAGVQTPGAYTVDVARSTWTTTKACYTVTVKGNGTSQFDFGWNFDLDMSAAYANVTNFSNWSNPTDNLWQLTWTTAGTNEFHAVSNTQANIAGTQQYVFTYCADGW
jgi:hypothetical protein